jgi:hypothetical protein
MQHQLFLVGNWKMNPETEKQAIALAVAYKSALVFKIFIQKNQVHIPEKFRFQ